MAKIALLGLTAALSSMVSVIAAHEGDNEYISTLHARDTTAPSGYVKHKGQDISAGPNFQNAVTCASRPDLADDVPQLAAACNQMASATATCRGFNTKGELVCAPRKALPALSADSSIDFYVRSDTVFAADLKPSAEWNAIIHQYAPIYRFHKEEAYWPVNPVEWFDGSTLWQRRATDSADGISSETTFDHNLHANIMAKSAYADTASHQHDWEFLTPMMADGSPVYDHMKGDAGWADCDALPILCGSPNAKTDINSMPVYAIAVDKPEINAVDVFYWIFFGYNQGKEVGTSIIANDIKGVLARRNFFDMLKHGFEDFGHAVVDTGKAAVSGVVNVAKDIGHGDIAGAFSDAGGTVVHVADTAATNALHLGEGVVSGVVAEGKAIVANPLGALKAGVNDLVDEGKTIVNDAVAEGKKIVTDPLGAAKDVVTGAITKVDDVLGSNTVVQNHFADLEHIVIRFNRATKQPSQLHMDHHGNTDGWSLRSWNPDGSPDKFTVQGVRPIVYIAKGSHELYPVPGEFPTFAVDNAALTKVFKAAAKQVLDHTEDGGVEWDSQHNLQIRWGNSEPATEPPSYFYDDHNSVKRTPTKEYSQAVA
ncbi:hypothetical protein HK101_000839 [Irineochytrium annulatum]|nr:hypothetical protein HK101_000839 [Irineochytrium annulatum]